MVVSYSKLLLAHHPSDTRHHLRSLLAHHPSDTRHHLTHIPRLGVRLELTLIPARMGRTAMHTGHACSLVPPLGVEETATSHRPARHSPGPHPMPRVEHGPWSRAPAGTTDCAFLLVWSSPKWCMSRNKSRFVRDTRLCTGVVSAVRPRHAAGGACPRRR